MAGYSGTPLPKKLGIKVGHCVALIGAPDRFEEQLPGLPEGVAVRRDGADLFDVAILFCLTAACLDERISAAKARMRATSALWIAWPKKAGGLQTDMTEALARERGLASGLVDIKICAIDEVWSGLKFVYRVADRK